MLPIAQSLQIDPPTGAADYTCSLTYEERFLRRRKLSTDCGKNFVVDDVKAENNYISCNIHVKAEIVIPLFKEGINIGQLDVDSHTLNPFSKKDEYLLEWVNEKVALIL